MNALTKFDSELIAGAHIDYQVKVTPVGNFPPELSPVLLTGAFPLSPSPTPKGIEGLKIFTYQQRYLCYCWFFQAGRRDELGRQTSSARVLIFSLALWSASIPVLADVREWLTQHDLENMTSEQFQEALLSLADSSLSPALSQKAQQTQWFPRLLAESIQQGQVELVALTQVEALQLLEILWHYAPDFFRFQAAWCTYIWSLRTDHEEIIAALGQIEPPPSIPFWQRLFKESKQESSQLLRFDITQGTSSQGTQTIQLERLELLCREWIQQQQWQNWQDEEKIKFLTETLKRLSRNPHTNPCDLVTGYPTSPKIQDFLRLFPKK